MATQHSGFKKQAIRYGFSHLMLSGALALSLQSLVNAIDRNYSKKLHRGFTLKFDDDQTVSYMNQASNVLVWHGTGRYEKTENGQILDIFDLILKSNELKPAIDIYDMFNGEMRTISTTPSRIITRCYADIHTNDIAHVKRYGDGFFWVSYFYSKIYAELFFRNGLKFIRKYPAWIKVASESGSIATIKWGKKVNANASLWNTFKLGSDILDNYPILFGIKSYDNAVATSSFMTRAEVRIGDTVSLTNISHLEVPEDKVEEIKSITLKNGWLIDVYSIELGEYIASKQRFSNLLYPK